MRLFIFILLILSPLPANANPIVTDLGVRSVDIDHDFDGMSLLMFGAQNSAGRVVVALRGPKRKYIVRKKERVAGIWVNGKTIEFEDTNSYYALASTHPLKEIHNDNLLSNFEIGLDNLKLSTMNISSKKPSSEVTKEFREALIKAKLAKNLYADEIEKVSFWGETLFRTNLTFPKNIERGWYTAEIYLFSNGILSAVQSTPIKVSKIGVEAYLFDAAHKTPLLYGLICVFMALFTGWLANAIFRRS